MARQRNKLDETDIAILEILQTDCQKTLGRIAEELKIPKSTVHYRVKRLEEEKMILGYYAKVDGAKIGNDYLTITFVRAKYGPSYHKRVGKELTRIPGVLAVYFIFGQTDFVVLTRSNDRDDFMKKLEKMTNMTDIERTHTKIVAKILKEDFRVCFDDKID